MNQASDTQERTVPMEGELSLLAHSAIEEVRGDLNERLHRLHRDLRSQPQFDAVDRIAIAIHEPATDLLRTFAQSSDVQSPLSHYAATLSNVPSLKRLVDTRRLRVIDDLAGAEGTTTRHSSAIAQSGYRSSVTLPMFNEGEFYGFVFFNSRRVGFFRDERFRQLLPYAGLVTLLGVSTLRNARIFRGAARTALAFSAVRDDETAEHQHRVAHFSRIIAGELAEAHRLSDEYIEMLVQFAPLHDIGKVGVPDAILRKPGRLTVEEYLAIKTHVGIGCRMVDTMMQELGLHGLKNAEILRNVVAAHHEAWDGSGYPLGLKGDRIPLEGRILAVADVFDALTSKRPYKDPWSNDAAVAYLQQKAGSQFDPECVQALLQCLPRVLEIQHRYPQPCTQPA